MPESFGPDGQSVELGGVRLTAYGLSGNFDVHEPAAPGRRAAELVSDQFLAALQRCGVAEQLTIEIVDAQEHPESLAEAMRGETVEEPTIEVEVPSPGSGNEQVLLAIDEEGKVSWHYSTAAAHDAWVQRAEDRRSYRVPARVVSAGGEGRRGLIGAMGRRLLKPFVFRLVDPVLGAVGDFFVSRWEAKNRPHRLRRFAPDGYLLPDSTALSPEDLAALGRGPALMFVHGTFSTAHGAFALIPRPVMEKLFARYEGRVFAFDHPSVSVTPTENVRWLATQLPNTAGVTADIVAHSRGGLVGRVMCEHARDCGLDPMQLTIRTLVMVGTPNAGTPLASHQHLGACLDTITNLLEFFPDNPATDVLETVLTVIKQVAVGALKGLDGLESMNAEGDYLTKFLNRPSDVSARYRALAADYDAGRDAPLGRFARDRLTDLVFGGKHNDLVVPTKSVYEANGGAAFPISEPVVFAASDGVEHGGYWNQPRAIEAFDRWLTGSSAT